MTRILAILAAVALTSAMAGCGVRGALQAPAGEAAPAATASADSGQGKAEGTAPKPHKGFILDGLLR